MTKKKEPKKLIDKKHVQGFIAGFMMALILFAGVYVSLNPSFLFGSMTKTATVGGDNFDNEVLKSDRPVLVYFYVPWMVSYAKTLNDAIDKMAEHCQEFIKVVKVDANEEGKLITDYKIMNAPTMIMFNEGQIIARKIGKIEGSKLPDWVDSLQLNWIRYTEYARGYGIDNEIPTVCKVFLK